MMIIVLLEFIVSIAMESFSFLLQFVCCPGSVAGKNKQKKANKSI
jgi:hypothetical protein